MQSSHKNYKDPTHWRCGHQPHLGNNAATHPSFLSSSSLDPCQCSSTPVALLLQNLNLGFLQWNTLRSTPNTPHPRLACFTPLSTLGESSLPRGNSPVLPKQVFCPPLSRTCHRWNFTFLRFSNDSFLPQWSVSCRRRGQCLVCFPSNHQHPAKFRRRRKHSV